MSTPFRLLLPRQIYEAMLAQARMELPNECCGQLAGRLEDGVARVERRYPLVNALASPTEYSSDPRDMFRAAKEMRSLGLEVVAVYHSHPTSEPVPSRKDLEWNYWPGIIQFIISLATEPPRVRGWWLEADHYVEACWEVVGNP